MNCVILQSGTIINLESIAKVEQPSSWRSRPSKIYFTGDNGQISEPIDHHDYEVIIDALNRVNAIVIDDDDKENE